MVEAAASNHGSGEDVMMLLLGRRGVDVPIPETVVNTTALNRRSGRKGMKILLKQRGADVRITEEVMKAAARNLYGSMMTLLLE